MNETTKLLVKGEVNAFLYNVGELKGYVQALSASTGRSIPLIDDLDGIIEKLRGRLDELLDEDSIINAKPVTVDSPKEEVEEFEAKVEVLIDSPPEDSAS